MSLLCAQESIRHDPDRIADAFASGRPFTEFAQLFPDSLQALLYYAKATGGRYAQPLSAGCVCCDQAADRAMTVTWEAPITTKSQTCWNILLFLLLLCTHHTPGKYPSVRFQTTHAFCRSCARTASAKRALGQLLHYLFFTLLIVSLFFAVIAVILPIAVAFSTAGGAEATRMIVCWPLLALPLVACFYGFRLVRQLRIPQALRQIGQRPFDLLGPCRRNRGT